MNIRDDIRIVRMWINQPLPSEPLHDLHGTNVLAVDDMNNMSSNTMVFFLSGDIVAKYVPNSSLTGNDWLPKNS